MKKIVSIIKWSFISIGLILLIVGVPLSIYSFFQEEVEKTLQPAQDLEKYAELRAQWPQDLVGHFPSEIPATASLKKFSHFPGLMQGNGHIQLRLRLPPEKIRELYDQFAKQRTISCRGNELCSMPTTFFYTSDGNNNGPFPSDFEVMVFDKYIPEKFQRKSHGVAISTSSNEIVYWADRW